jgi:hypothetical protein
MRALLPTRVPPPNALSDSKPDTASTFIAFPAERTNVEPATPTLPASTIALPVFDRPQMLVAAS